MPKDRPVSKVKTTNINPLSLPVCDFSILSWKAGVVFFVFFSVHFCEAVKITVIFRRLDFF